MFSSVRVRADLNGKPESRSWSLQVQPWAGEWYRLRLRVLLTLPESHIHKDTFCSLAARILHRNVILDIKFVSKIQFITKEWTTVLLKHHEAYFQQPSSLRQVLGNRATYVCSFDLHSYNKNVKMFPVLEHLTAQISNKEELFQSTKSVWDVCFFNWMQTGCGISFWKKRLNGKWLGFPFVYCIIYKKGWYNELQSWRIQATIKYDFRFTHLQWVSRCAICLSTRFEGSRAGNSLVI